MALHDPIELDAAEAREFLKIRTGRPDKKQAATLQKIDEYIRNPPFKSE